MTDTALFSLVVERIASQPAPDGAGDLVLAAFAGRSAVDAALGGQAEQPVAVTDGAKPAAAAAAYLTAIEVEGFRGVGERTTLSVDPGPGLTLVVGRNGSGKSSFSEALEMVLLGSNQRWKDRSKVWQDGWQNLHLRHSSISARFTVDGRPEPLVVTRSWNDGAALDDSALLIDGKPKALDTLGWTEPLAAYPPLLSHHELESALDAGPSKLYDALASILGLSQLTDAQNALRDARLEMEHTSKRAREAVVTLRALLEQTDDERATTVLAALKPKQWDVETIERTVAGSGGGDEHGVLRRLRDLAGLPVLERERLTSVVTALREAHDGVQRLRDSDAARAHATAELLQQALDVHAHTEGETCPVCGTSNVLTYEWRLRAVARVTELRAEAAQAEAAARMLGESARAARQLVSAPPLALGDARDIGVDTGAVTQLWERWAEVPDGDDVMALAAHLESQGLRLIAAVADLRREAAAELERRERSWRPAAEAILQWLPLARAARDAETSVARLKNAEAWLKSAHDELRDQRFKPIADAVQANWTALRQDSNVKLGDLRLAGAASQRRLTLDVTVDGEPGSALGVMSQGELNCLALSLFLPRAAMPESPFRFVVIDDPVQAMDPAKVEGLATMLARAAQERQVIVLTHDTRLADAVRFLDIQATVIEVLRRESSVVELRRILDPVQRYIDDAFAVAKTKDLPVEAQRVIPGFCRLALEAASALAATRRMLREGKRYAQVQAVLAQPSTLLMWLGLALLGDAQRGGDVRAHLQRQQPWAVDAVMECNRGAHSGVVARDLMAFIRAVERLSKEIAPEASRA